RRCLERATSIISGGGNAGFQVSCDRAAGCPALQLRKLRSDVLRALTSGRRGNDPPAPKRTVVRSVGDHSTSASTRAGLASPPLILRGAAIMTNLFLPIWERLVTN